MAETLISPGVLARENDSSFVTARPIERGAAIIGPTVKGPIEQPTLVSSYSSFQAIFGDKLQSGSNEYSYLTSVAANNYFQNGGNSLLVTRVVSGSTTQDWTPATSSEASSQTGIVAAFGIHKTLVENEGFDTNSPEYYDEIDKRMRYAFPHKFNGVAVEETVTISEARRPQQAVASAVRSSNSGSKTVRLSPSEVAIAKKLGVPLDEYAKHKAS